MDFGLQEKTIKTEGRKPLLDVHQLLMLLAGTLTYLGPGTFSSIVFYNML
jgi:hypothetical protein